MARCRRDGGGGDRRRSGRVPRPHQQQQENRRGAGRQVRRSQAHHAPGCHVLLSKINRVLTVRWCRKAFNDEILTKQEK